MRDGLGFARGEGIGGERREGIGARGDGRSWRRYPPRDSNSRERNGDADDVLRVGPGRRRPHTSSSPSVRQRVKIGKIYHPTAPGKRTVKMEG